MTYDLYVGLALNADRALNRQAAATMRAIGWYFGTRLPWEYFDAIAENEDDVADLMVNTNLQRQLTAHLARRR